ncbi:hypothetical protein Naga_102885g1 [Nannochloropsis gaditana]|uniref:Uncharacterized protein n=1 Tax=Nannochloropsis gaditana TaxID=72520 RepID=W7T9K9_9STRA|nr:hypothetical protein Naga_102885g1 [Nannochloropsis gaditana]
MRRTGWPPLPPPRTLREPSWMTRPTTIPPTRPSTSIPTQPLPTIPSPPRQENGGEPEEGREGGGEARRAFGPSTEWQLPLCSTVHPCRGRRGPKPGNI